MFDISAYSFLLSLREEEEHNISNLNNLLHETVILTMEQNDDRIDFQTVRKRASSNDWIKSVMTIRHIDQTSYQYTKNGLRRSGPQFLDKLCIVPDEQRVEIIYKILPWEHISRSAGAVKIAFYSGHIIGLEGDMLQIDIEDTEPTVNPFDIPDVVLDTAIRVTKDGSDFI